MCRQRSFFPPEILLWHQKHIWEVGCSNFQKMWANTSPPRERDDKKIPPLRVWNFEPEGKHICIPALEKKITHLYFKERTISWLYCFFVVEQGLYIISIFSQVPFFPRRHFGSSCFYTDCIRRKEERQERGWPLFSLPPPILTSLTPLSHFWKEIFTALSSFFFRHKN